MPKSSKTCLARDFVIMLAAQLHLWYGHAAWFGKGEDGYFICFYLARELRQLVASLWPQ
jgi:hypothetical protein